MGWEEIGLEEGKKEKTETNDLLGVYKETRGVWETIVQGVCKGVLQQCPWKNS